ESRTLDMNNVHDGTWHGRGDTMCIGTEELLKNICGKKRCKFTRCLYMTWDTRLLETKTLVKGDEIKYQVYVYVKLDNNTTNIKVVFTFQPAMDAIDVVDQGFVGLWKYQ
nr:PLAC8 family protein [Tanacetum cinerariifolium]